MKKIRFMFVLGVLLLVGACSNADSEDAREIFNQSLQAMEEVNSFTLEMEVEQDFQVGEESMQMTLSLEGDVMLDPLAIHQKISTTGMNLPSTELDMYVADDQLYLFDSITNQWLKMSNDKLGDLMTLPEMQSDPTQELEKLNEYIDELNMSEEDGYYVLQLSASGDQYQTFVSDLLSDVDPSMATYDEALENLAIHHMEYEIKIDKETFYTSEMNINIDLTFDAEGESVTIKQDAHSVFSKFNEINEIVVPEDVVENAVEIGF